LTPNHSLVGYYQRHGTVATEFGGIRYLVKAGMRVGFTLVKI
jgi:hypothetical protein